jgi:hypothetical protein
MITPMLREMRAENATRHGEVLDHFDLVEQRLAALEKAQVSFKQAHRGQPAEQARDW